MNFSRASIEYAGLLTQLINKVGYQFIGERRIETEEVYFFSIVSTNLSAFLSAQIGSVRIHDKQDFERRAVENKLLTYDLLDFLCKLQNPDFHNNIRKGWSNLPPLEETASPDCSDEHPRSINGLREWSRPIRHSFWEVLFLAFSGRRDAIWYYCPTLRFVDHLFLYLSSLGKFVPIPHYYGERRGRIDSLRYNYDSRYSLFLTLRSELSSNDGEGIAFLLSCLLPLALLETRQENDNFLLKASTPKAVVLFEDNLGWDMRILGCMKVWRHRGTALITCAHGPNTGLGRVSTLTSLVSHCSTIQFFACDMVAHVKEGKLLALPDFRTYQDSRRYRVIIREKQCVARRSRLTYFGALDRSCGFSCYADDPVLASREIYRYNQQKVSLIEKLHHSFREILLIRGHPAESSKLKVFCRNNGIEFSSDSVAVDLCSRFLVFDYLSTVFFVALREGRPAFLVDNGPLDETRYSEVGLRFIYRLKKSRFFFNSADNLVQHLKTISRSAPEVLTTCPERVSLYSEFFGDGLSPLDSVRLLCEFADQPFQEPSE